MTAQPLTKVRLNDRIGSATAIIDYAGTRVAYLPVIPSMTRHVPYYHVRAK